MEKTRENLGIKINMLSMTVVDTPKNKELVFNLSNVMYSRKQQEGLKPQTSNKSS